MVGVQVEQSTLDRIHSILAGVQETETKVLKPAFTRGLMAGKTQAKKEVRQTYRISAGDFASNGKINLKGVTKTGGGLIGSVEYSGATIPLMKFKVNPSSPKQGATPSAAVLKQSGLVPFSREKDTFVAQMKTGHIGIFTRRDGVYSGKRYSETGKNKHSQAIKERYSPAVPTMVGKQEVMESVEDRVAEVINQRIDHEIDRIFNGIGG